MPTRNRVVRRRVLTAAVAGGAIAAIGGQLVARYRRDLEAARGRLASFDRQVISTEFGALEYAERGVGKPVLVSHGIFAGCDGALLAARDLVADRRVIAPSRFGYLGSALPPDATPAAQADAFDDLVDALGIAQIDVIGISAGTTSALQFALRHPDRVGHLVIVSGNWPGSPTATVQPWPARLAYGDLPMWALEVFAPSFLARLMGVPHGFALRGADAEFVTELSDSIFPVGPRAAGARFDAFVSNADVNRYPLEDLKVPTLIVHAMDDPLASYDAAQQAAARIPGAALIRIESGGHLLLGNTDRVQRELAAFLAEPANA
jgi:pimeloyl-ACP methyl ester carboxylesterase